MKVLSSYSLKGGVGKTTSAVNLAYLAGADGWRVLLWDLDVQGASTFILRGERRQTEIFTSHSKRSVGTSQLAQTVIGTNYQGVHVLPYSQETADIDVHLSRLKSPKDALTSMLGALSSNYDLIVIDNPPTGGVLARTVLAVSDLTLLMTTPTVLAERAYGEFLSSVTSGKRRQLAKVLTVLTMYEPRRNGHLRVAERLRTQGTVSVAATVLPRHGYVEHMAEQAAPLEVLHPKSTIAAAYRALWEEITPTLALVEP